MQAEEFDAAAEAAALTRGRADVGALVTFVGLCRDEGGRVALLEIEHYAGMAEQEIARVAHEAEARWPLLGVTIIHRFGTLAPGAPIVLVVTASAHRGAAFAAADFLMDYLKTRAPFWKRAQAAATVLKTGSRRSPPTQRRRRAGAMATDRGRPHSAA